MDRARILCGVLPDSIVRGSNVLQDYDVTFVTTLDEAHAALSAVDFRLVICGVHFDDGQMPLLLQHCRTDPRLKAVPFVGFRAGRSRLPESTYGHIREMTNLLGGVYVDLVHWTDTRGWEQALSDLNGVIATLLRGSPLPERPLTTPERGGTDHAGCGESTL
ncbi:MAG: hypothetical protein JWR21_2621 [Herminiimonas sp.]|nr:hypothetical protein [Herminiimonas sp.]